MNVNEWTLCMIDIYGHDNHIYFTCLMASFYYLVSHTFLIILLEPKLQMANSDPAKQ